MIARIARPLLAAGLFLAGVALLGVGAAWAAFPGHNGLIAFQSNRDRGNFEIYVTNPDGSCQTRVTDSLGFDGFPAWAPRGQRLAFQSNRDGDNEIYVMNADGSGQTRLTDSPGFEGGPAWSPDGRRIAFRSDRDGRPEIYVMNADGSSQTRLTADPGIDGNPAWSPDGRTIAFSRGEGPIRDSETVERSQIYVMNADGSGQTPLTPPGARDAAPDWSPDGRRIAFDSNRWGDPEIHVMTRDGSGVTRLTFEPGVDGGPGWSPDGTRIAFRSDRVGTHNIWTMNPDGSDPFQVTMQAWSNRRADWQSVRLPSNHFCLGNRRRMTNRGFVRQRLRVPGPGTAIVRRNDRVKRFATEVAEAGVARVIVRPRGAAKRRLDRAGTESRRVVARVRAEIGFRPKDGRLRTEEVRLRLIRIARR